MRRHLGDNQRRHGLRCLGIAWHLKLVSEGLLRVGSGLSLQYATFPARQPAILSRTAEIGQKPTFSVPPKRR